MASPMHVGTVEGQEILPNIYVDLEKGEKDLEAQPAEAAVKNQALASLITGIFSIVMVTLVAVYIVLVFVAFKNLQVGPASACSIIMAPFYIFTLVALKFQGDDFIERFAMTHKNYADSSNLPGENIYK